MSTTEDRPAVYADENVDARIVEALRERGFDVQTAREVGMLGQLDDSQLAHASNAGRVLLIFDQRDFRRLHARSLEIGRGHTGIVLLPQSRGRGRTVIRAAMLLDWFAALDPETSRLVTWNDLQLRLHRGHRVPGYGDDEVRVALGQALHGT